MCIEPLCIEVLHGLQFSPTLASASNHVLSFMCCKVITLINHGIFFSTLIQRKTIKHTIHLLQHLLHLLQTPSHPHSTFSSLNHHLKAIPKKVSISNRYIKGSSSAATAREEVTALKCFVWHLMYSKTMHDFAHAQCCNYTDIIMRVVGLICSLVSSWEWGHIYSEVTF